MIIDFFRKGGGGGGIMADFTLADIGGVEWFIVRSVEPRLTFVTVDSLRVVATVLTDAAAFVVAVDIQRSARTFYLGIELAFV